jgi:hypothetical protein
MGVALLYRLYLAAVSCTRGIHILAADVVSFVATLA